MKVKVSIAITTYNRMSYLKECIQSLFEQTFQDFLIYVFDDASVQPVEKELQMIGDKRIIFVGNKENIGSVGNINRVLNFNFPSQYLMIFHDDDALHPKALEIQTSILDANPDFVFVGTNLDFFQGKNILKFRDSADQVDCSVYKNNLELVLALLSGIHLAFSSIMYRQDALKKEKIDFDNFSVIADRPFLVNLAKRGACAFIKNKLVNYRLHAGQDSQSPKVLNDEHIFSLLSFYRFNLPSRLNFNFKKIFFTSSTNNILDSYLRMSDRYNFWAYMKKAKQKNLINFWFLNKVGLLAIFKIIVKKIKIWG